ncbi:MAG TPA: LysM peptidoglycan-binding domain-containing protein [Bacteroidetes bacterium]|nr:LysM peptidoglycan-binding domain-containing protein [Bacteroidota bacterium]
MNILKNMSFLKTVTSGTIFLKFIILLMLTAGCGTSRKTVVSHVSIKRQQYIRKYANLAIEEMNRTAIPASIIMAQALLESDDGNSYLAVYGNNHFGVKCHKDWKGKKIYFDDDKKHECFRKYKTVEESYRDHSDFIRNGQRYSFLFSLDTENYKAWAKGLKKAGYATNPHYDKMLIKIIEDNKLYELDDRKNPFEITPIKKKREETGNKKEGVTVVSSPEMSDEFTISFPSRKIMTNNRINYIIVKPGDTFESLTKELQMLSWELRKYNELPKNAILTPGQILYLQPKRKQAEPGKKVYIVKKGDNMYSISQKFGIRLKYLLDMNGMKQGEEPVPGQKIKLRK